MEFINRCAAKQSQSQNNTKAQRSSVPAKFYVMSRREESSGHRGKERTGRLHLAAVTMGQWPYRQVCHCNAGPGIGARWWLCWDLFPG